MPTRSDNKSFFQKNIEAGVADGILSYSDDGKKITYHCSRNYTVNIRKPEELVRASYFAELVMEYKYPKERIGIEVKVERRVPDDRADIVVYADDELKEPFLVVECKKDGITNAEFKQAIEQAFGNANSKRAMYAQVVAGTTKAAFDVAGFKSSEREKNALADIPTKYGKAPKYKYKKGDEKNELKIVNREELISALEKCHDTVWQGGKLAPTTAFDEVSKLLFCKLRDEKYMKKGGFYEFQIGTHESANEVYKRINEIYQKAKKDDEEVFKEDIKLEPRVVYTVVEHLQQLAINKIDLDTKGIAFEKFMQDFFRGKMGQFFTPRNIVNFNIQMLNPQLDETVLDPACGSGGFLLACLDYIREYCAESYDEPEATHYWHDYAKTKLFGIEINDQIARVCKMNMIIHDDGHTNIISTDALNFFKEIKKVKPRFKPNSFDIIPANPPFGAKVKKAEKEEKYLDQYEMGKGKNTQKTEILFIERCIEFLKPGTGRMGLVLPDGILTNSSLQAVRDVLLMHCQLLAVVSLPQFAFAHFGAGVKSSLVFCRRKDKDEVLPDDYPIFMAIADTIGYDATGRDTPENDLDDIVKQYREFRKQPDFFV